MITFSIIKKSQLEGGERLDAEYYQPEYLLVNKLLMKLGAKRLSEILSRKVVTGSTPTIRDCKNDGTDIKFIKTDTVRNGEIVFDLADSLPLNKNIKNSELQAGDVLVTIIGATYDIVGRTALYFDDDPKSNINQNIALLRAKKEILPGYLEAFLLGKFGRDQLWQQSRQTEQVNLNCREVENIYVPVFQNGFRTEIDSIIRSARIAKLDSIQLYKQAKELLLKELGLKDFKEENDLSYVVNFSDVQNADRIDAEFFQTKYERIIERIKNYKEGWEPLENLTSLIGHPSNPPYEKSPSKDKTFIITQKHLADYFPEDKFWEDEEALYTTDEFIKKNKTYLLKENDIILYSVGAYIGKANMYTSNVKATIGSFLTLLRPNQELINPYYLLIFLNSSIGQLLTRRNSRGLAQQYIYPYDTKQILIPKLDNIVQSQIEDYIKMGQKAKQKSKELLEEAKRKVEEMIEKGGEN